MRFSLRRSSNRRWALGLGLSALCVVAACKTANNKAGVKDENDAPPVIPPATDDPADTSTDQAADKVGMDVNDFSILFPKDANGLPFPEIVLDGAVDDRGTQLWPKATAFDALINFAADKTPGAPAAAQAPVFTNFEDGTGGADSSLSLADAPKFQKATIKSFFLNGKEQNDAASVVNFAGPLAVVPNQANWRVVSLRFDPCAEQDANVCNVEFRLIAQPFDPVTKKPLDVAAHLLYNMGQLSTRTKELLASKRTKGLPANVTFQRVLKDLQTIKSASLALGAAGKTDGVPLGVHPGLKEELRLGGNNNAPNLIANLVKALIRLATQGGLTTVTSMQITKPGQPWLFFVGEVKNGTWTPVTITGGSPSMFIRFDAGAQGFTPEPTNSSGLSNSKLMGAAAGANEFTNSFIIDNPGKFGDANPRNSVNNTDCISCHVGATAIRRIPAMSAATHGLKVNPATGKPSMYVPAEGVTGYMGVGSDGTTSVVADGLWDFRNFGAHNRGVNASVMSRQLNEAAEVARFVNEDIIGVPNPGFVCKAGATAAVRAKNHAALWDCNVKQGTALAACAATICK